MKGFNGSIRLKQRIFSLAPVRFWNPDVLTNTDGVLEMILLELDKSPHPSAG
ncbi:hypothetical protein [Parvibaculum sp.]|uniref:hypothetical protein n=1 Tax=Parvibaculum sp. TaxID=2024848 RepID=UPI00329A5574